MMEIRVSTTVRALHCWPEASGVREYLKHPHMHDFRVTAWADVNHADRDIEFHDLRDDLQAALISRTSCKRLTGDRGEEIVVYDFGRASCEDLGNWILGKMPHVKRVRVMEDADCGAEVYRDSRPRPPVVTICGSTRFKQAWLDAMKQLEIEGVATFQVGSFMHADDEDISEEQKEFFDYIHKRKIDISDGIYVLNVDGYIGESTASEIRYARRLGKYVRFLEPDNVPEEFR